MPNIKEVAGELCEITGGPRGRVGCVNCTCCCVCPYEQVIRDIVDIAKKEIQEEASETTTDR